MGTEETSWNPNSHVVEVDEKEEKMSQVVDRHGEAESLATVLLYDCLVEMSERRREEVPRRGEEEVAGMRSSAAPALEFCITDALGREGEELARRVITVGVVGPYGAGKSFFIKEFSDFLEKKMGWRCWQTSRRNRETGESPVHPKGLFHVPTPDNLLLGFRTLDHERFASVQFVELACFGAPMRHSADLARGNMESMFLDAVLDMSDAVFVVVRHGMSHESNRLLSYVHDLIQRDSEQRRIAVIHNIPEYLEDELDTVARLFLPSEGEPCRYQSLEETSVPFVFVTDSNGVQRIPLGRRGAVVNESVYGMLHSQLMHGPSKRVMSLTQLVSSALTRVSERHYERNCVFVVRREEQQHEGEEYHVVEEGEEMIRRRKRSWIVSPDDKSICRVPHLRTTSIQNSVSVDGDVLGVRIDARIIDLNQTSKEGEEEEEENGEETNHLKFVLTISAAGFTVDSFQNGGRDDVDEESPRFVGSIRVRSGSVTGELRCRDVLEVSLERKQATPTSTFLFEEEGVTKHRFDSELSCRGGFLRYYPLEAMFSRQGRKNWVWSRSRDGFIVLEIPSFKGC